MDIRKNLDSLLESLPTLPDVVAEIGPAVEDGNNETIADVVRKDAVVAGRLVSASNSPLWGPAPAESTLETAVLRLGPRRVDALVKTIAIASCFEARTAAFAPEKFWPYSLAVATLTWELRGRLGPRRASRAYLAGLLHRIGEVFLATNWPERLISCVADSSSETEKQVAAEFGLDTPALSEAILRKWGLDDRTCSAARWQLEPERTSTARSLDSWAIFCARELCLLLGVSALTTSPTYDWAERVPAEIREALFGSDADPHDLVDDRMTELLELVSSVYTAFPSATGGGA